MKVRYAQLFYTERLSALTVRNMRKEEITDDLCAGVAFRSHISGVRRNYQYEIFSK